MTPSRGALRPRDFLLVALLALLSHLRSLGNQLVFDDRSAILENLTVTGAFDLRRLFAFDFWGLPAGQGVGTWRPLVTLSFIVDRRIGGTEEEQQLRLAAALSKTYPDQLELARFLLDHNRAEEARAVFSSP